MRSFDEMPTLAQHSPEHSPRRRSSRGWARRCERGCMSCLTMFPLVFVYGLTTWAVYVQASIGFLDPQGPLIGKGTAILGIVLYILLNWSYTAAVFTDPGSPLNSSPTAYAALPTHDSPDTTSDSLTVKSTGETRFCKKCQTRKPDRAHHCSTCRRCVLKMDHHCPWLATCVGLHNYKPFLLFLIYVVLFCWLCFAAAGLWTAYAILGDAPFGADARLMPVNYILLAVLAGILGLVLAGFTAWHVYLTVSGQTTIESLEKNRYISPVKRSLQATLDPGRHATEPSLANHLREIHANAIPGVTRPEEGEQLQEPSPAQRALRMSYAESEAARERARYSTYLDELDSAKLPNAFDHGWSANLRAVFGPAPLAWGLPLCNSEGDGWTWAPSHAWMAAREDLARSRSMQNGWQSQPQQYSQGYPAQAQSMRGPPPRNDGVVEASNDDDDEDDDGDSGQDQSSRHLLPQSQAGGQWNDVPADMLGQGQGSGRGIMRTRSPRPARAYPKQ